MGDSSVAGSYSKKEQSYIKNEITDRYGTFNYDKDQKAYRKARK